MFGHVLRWEQDEERGFGVIEDRRGDWYRASGKDIELDCLGRTLLIPGEPVTFEKSAKTFPKPSSGCGVGYYAENITRPHKDTTSDYRKHTEIVKVLDENYVIRSLGGRLTIDTEDPERPFLSYGMIVRCRVRPGGTRPDGKPYTWRAHDIKILGQSEDDVDWSALEAAEAA